MPVAKRIPECYGLHFITFTCFDWVDLFEITNSYDLVYKWFDYLKAKHHLIIGFVIMPNHLHALIAFRNTGKSINTIIGNGKRFLAYGMIARLKLQGRNDILKKLYLNVEATDRKRGKIHEVWENSFCWTECWSFKFILQKLNYIHNNPCQKKRKLVDKSVDYVHSSAGFYFNAEPGIYSVTHFMDLLSMDLSVFVE